MGGMKSMMIEREELALSAAEVAILAGAVKRCEYHEEVLIDQYDGDALREAYKIGNAKITRGEINLPSWCSRRDFSDLVKKIVEESGDECYECDRVFNRED